MIFRKKASGDLYKIKNLKKRNSYNYKSVRQNTNIRQLQEVANIGDESRYLNFVTAQDKQAVQSAASSPDATE